MVLLNASSPSRRTVSAYAGKGRDFGDVQRALEALQEAYRERGYSAVRPVRPFLLLGPYVGVRLACRRDADVSGSTCAT